MINSGIDINLKDGNGQAALQKGLYVNKIQNINNNILINCSNERWNKEIIKKF